MFLLRGLLACLLLPILGVVALLLVPVSIFCQLASDTVVPHHDLVAVRFVTAGLAFLFGNSK